MVSVIATQFCCCSLKVAVDKEMNDHGCVPVTSHLQKQSVDYNFFTLNLEESSPWLLGQLHHPHYKDSVVSLDFTVSQHFTQIFIYNKEERNKV